MSWRDGDTTEFPAVGAGLPGGRQPTHVVGPWALGTRDATSTFPAAEVPGTELTAGVTEAEPIGGPLAGADQPGAARPGEPQTVTSPRRRRALLGLAAAAAVVLVGTGGVAIGAALDSSPSTSPAGATTSTTGSPGSGSTGQATDEGPAAGPAGAGPAAEGPGEADQGGGGGPAGGPAAGGPGSGGPRG